MNNWNWPLIGHLIVGTIITTCQALATTYPTNLGMVNVCHIVSLVVITIGVSLGVWQSQQTTLNTKRTATMTIGGVTVPVEEPLPEKEPVKAPEAAKTEESAPAVVKDA
jgi:hypothetical protein